MGRWGVGEGEGEGEGWMKKIIEKKSTLFLYGYSLSAWIIPSMSSIKYAGHVFLEMNKKRTQCKKVD